jgi:hypothetical protein
MIYFHGGFPNNSPMCACQEFPIFSSKMLLYSPEPAPKHLPPELDHVCLPCAWDICSSVGPEMEEQLFQWFPGFWKELERYYYNFYTPDEHGANVDRLSQEAYDEKCLDHQRCAEQLVAKYAANSDREGEEGKEEDEAKQEASSTKENQQEEHKEENGKRKKKKKKRQGRKAKKVERMQTLEEKEDEGDSEERETGRKQKESGQEEGKGMGEGEGEKDGEGEEKEEVEEEDGEAQVIDDCVGGGAGVSGVVGV